MTGPRTLRFLNEDHEIATEADWNSHHLSKLWLYNAHYFDDLAADDAGLRGEWHRNLLARWIAENPPTKGNGWEPYPSSLRIVNWSKWALAGNMLNEVGSRSLALQARWLSQNVELHLLGNHVLANAKALIFAGTLFRGEEAAVWLSSGLRLFQAQIAEQVLADGGHFERSPMYHATILEDLLDLIQLSRIFPDAIGDSQADRWRVTAAEMLAWLQAMTHPDGGPAFFNDCAFGISGQFSELTAYAKRLGLGFSELYLGGAKHLADSGYFRLQCGAAVVLGDLAPVGPDYQPGHAHADTLSFELSVAGKRLIVNGGTSTYEIGPERARQRSTAAHNTLTINERNSSDVWAAFRVGRRARVSRSKVESLAGSLVAEGAHDGYARLPGSPVHSRRWRLEPGRLTVSDEVSAPVDSAVARFRFAPGTRIRMEGPQNGVVDTDGPCLRWKVTGDCEVEIERGTWHPRFGMSEPCDVLAISMRTPALETQFSWDELSQ